MLEKYRYRITFNMFLFFIPLLSLNAQVEELKWAQPVNISRLNSEKDDFAPIWDSLRNTMYFNSERNSYSFFYSSSFNEEGDFLAPEIIKGGINESGKNQSFISLKGENSAILSTFRMSERRSYLNLFESSYIKRSWSKPELIAELQADCFMSHPAVSPDGSYMIFVSDKDSESGDTDLWIAFFQDNGSWGGLMQINELNTLGNEITPYLASPDTLFFASDGLGGLGGQDVYYSVRLNGVWQNPYPLTDINTEFNESDFSLLPGGSAVFASDRPGGMGGLDLYKTEAPREEQVEVSEMEISIGSSFTSKIKTNASLAYRTFSFIPFVFAGKDNLAFPNGAFNPELIAPNPDSIYIYGIALLADRMNHHAKAKLKINIITYEFNDNSYSADNNLIEKIRNYLIDSKNIDESRIVFERIIVDRDTNSIPNAPILYFQSNNPDILAPVRAGDYETAIFPPLIEARLIARPDEILSKWNCGLKINDDTTNFTFESSSNSASFIIDFADYESLIASADSLIICATGTDTLDRTCNARKLFNISHSEAKTKGLVLYKGKRYEQFTVFSDYSELLLTDNFNENIKDRIIETYLNKPGSRIVILPASNEGSKNAEKLADDLKQSSGGNKLKIKIETPDPDFPPTGIISPRNISYILVSGE